MLLSSSVLFVISFFLVLYFFKKLKCVSAKLYNLGKLDGPSNHNIIIGNVLRLHAAPEVIFKKLRQWARDYYPVYQLRAIHIPAACILAPEDFEAILSNPRHIEKSMVYLLLHDWLGTGLLTSGGQKWATRRKILTPAFHFSILQQFITIFNEETDKLVDTFKQQCDQPIEITSHITQFTLKTIGETAMGTKFEFTTRKQIEYKQAILEIGEILLYRLLNSWLISDYLNFFSPHRLREKRLVKTLHTFTRDVITEREKTFEKFQLPTEEHDVYIGKKRLAMLDLLLTAKNEERTIDEDGIREEVDTFMFEGHDTTSAALSFALMLLANHKNVQDQIVDEMVTVLGDLHQKPTYNNLQEMKYLERAIKESLRLYPSVHFISRKLGEDFVTCNGLKLPKSTITHLHIYDLHHNPDIYPDPEKFDPERFRPENSQKRHPFAYLPFSAGPRNCIGQKFAMLELKAAICGILANFILEPVDTPESIVLVVDLVLRTKNGIKIGFIPRVK
ncbi:cytochrome P450 monooxigenase CYP4Q3 [Tribolium castaneum]|uniref:Cytochrome P450-like protein n=1 Tax=Tribolium castaneum TaxID=7070 RepID=D6X2S8_TRICA|nr:cytochrome P450 monooxigenase CYP4Q3 [Tribolium castaneum]EFA10752.1 cytochrome P450-like protein [Tribolium castaneum]|eukprot:NP_001107847.1 cytochrome P450 monooxigenase CYP4Q3 [Tribolium castaneum]